MPNTKWRDGVMEGRTRDGSTDGLGKSERVPVLVFLLPDGVGWCGEQTVLEMAQMDKRAA